MRLRQAALYALMALAPAVPSADELDCYLPSLKDGEVLERMSISLGGGTASVHHVQTQQSYRPRTERDREILFHHFSHPIEAFGNGKEHEWGPPQSVILMRNIVNRGLLQNNNEEIKLEFEPDILVVDWKARAIMTTSAGRNSFTTRWKCL